MTASTQGKRAGARPLLAAQEGPFGRGEFGAIVRARKQVAVGVRGHADGRVAESALHHFQRQFVSRDNQGEN
jgi:hypothetical protein